MRFYIISIFIGAALAAAKDSLPLLNVAKLPAGMSALTPQFVGSLDEPSNTADELSDPRSVISDGVADSPSLVKIFALNRDNNLPASLSDTAISEAANGTPQLRNASVITKSEEEFCLPKVDLVFLLDTSGSIEQLYQEHVRWAVALVESLPIEEETVRVAAVQYAGFPLTEFALGTYPNSADIRRHLAKIGAQTGVSRTGYALRKAEAELFREERGARRDAKKVIVLFTDGLSIDDPLKPAQQLRDLKAVTIYVVSVGKDGAGFAHEMNRIAGTRENVFGPEDLPRLREALIAEAERARACTRVGAAKSNVFAEKSPAFRIATTAGSTPVTTIANPTTASSSKPIDELTVTPTTAAYIQPLFQESLSLASTETPVAETINVMITTITAEELKPAEIAPLEPLEDELTNFAPLSDIADDILLLNALNEERGAAQHAVITARHNNNKNDTISVITTVESPSESDTVADGKTITTVISTTTENATIIDNAFIVTKASEPTNETTINSTESKNASTVTFDGDTATNITDSSNDVSTVSTLATKTTKITIDNGAVEALDVFEMSNAARQMSVEFTPLTTTTRRQLSRVTFEPGRAATIISPSKPSLTVDVAANRGVFTPRILASGSATPKRNLLKVEKEKNAVELKSSQQITERPFTPTGQGWRFFQTSTILASSPVPTIATRRIFSTIRSTTLFPTVTTTRRPARLFAAPRPQSQSQPRLATSGCAADWLFVVDSSGSVQKIYDAQKEYLNDVLEDVQLEEDLAGHRVALLQFAGSEIQKMEWSYDAYHSHDALMNAFHQVRHITGTTYIGAALDAAAQVLKTRRRHLPSVIVLLSDGFSQDDVSAAAAALNRQPNVDVYALSIADLSNTELLTTVTGRPDNVFVGGEGAAALRRLLADRLQCRQRRPN